MTNELRLPISNIEIENFRGIKHAKISDFKRVNLLVGKNNSGKSTVLESLYLLLCSYRGEIQQWTNALKERHPIYDEQYWEALFYRFDSHKNVLRIQESEMRRIEINLDGSALKVSNTVADYSIYFGFENSEQMEVSRNQQGVMWVIPVTFLSTFAMRDILETLSDDFDKIQDAKLISLLCDAVRPIEPNIRDFRMSSKRVVKADIASIPKLIPVNLLGDGMARILGIIMKIATSKDGVVLIDDIESGFHYSTLETMWKAVFEAAKNFNVQIFATTHSKECIEAFAKIESNEDDRRLFRLSKKEDKTWVTKYRHENLLAAFEIEAEVR